MSDYTMELRHMAETMRAGSNLSRQAFGVFETEDGRTCALGASIAVVKDKYPESIHKWYGPNYCEILNLEFPIIFHAFLPMSEEQRRDPVICPERECFNETSVYNLIAHINNIHHWSREAIAEFLDWYAGELEKNETSPKVVTQMAEATGMRVLEPAV